MFSHSGVIIALLFASSGADGDCDSDGDGNDDDNGDSDIGKGRGESEGEGDDDDYRDPYAVVSARMIVSVMMAMTIAMMMRKTTRNV